MTTPSTYIFLKGIILHDYNMAKRKKKESKTNLARLFLQVLQCRERNGKVVSGMLLNLNAHLLSISTLNSNICLQWYWNYLWNRSIFERTLSTPGTKFSSWFPWSVYIVPGSSSQNQELVPVVEIQLQTHAQSWSDSLSQSPGAMLPTHRVVVGDAAGLGTLGESAWVAGPLTPCRNRVLLVWLSTEGLWSDKKLPG